MSQRARACSPRRADQRGPQAEAAVRDQTTWSAICATLKRQSPSSQDQFPMSTERWQEAERRREQRGNVEIATRERQKLEGLCCPARLKWWPKKRDEALKQVWIELARIRLAGALVQWMPRGGFTGGDTVAASLGDLPLSGLGAGVLGFTKRCMAVTFSSDRQQRQHASLAMDGGHPPLLL